MKILFVTHTTGYGGAAISLSTNLKYLLDNGHLKPNECVIAAPSNKQGILTEAYSKFNAKVPFYLWQMPFSTAYKGGSVQVHAKLYSIVKEITAILLWSARYNRIIRRVGITHIHLNSMVFWSLLPFLPKDVKKIIHVRELITDDYSGKIARKIINKYADTIIAISQQTAKGLPGAVIVENPYDMYRARQYRNVRAELKATIDLPGNSFVVSVFSPIGVQKGSDFLLHVIRNIPKDLPIHFLLVGDPFRGEKEIYQSLKAIPNVRIHRTSNEMDRYYAVTDVVLRCEPYLPLGRTVYEGIYAGCIALLPIAEDDNMEEIDGNKQVWLYRAGDAKECARRIGILHTIYSGGLYDNGFEPTSNVERSAGKFLEVLK